MATIERAEHDRRLAAVRDALEQRSLDALLCYAPPEQPGCVTYLTGYRAVFVPVWCVVTADRCVLFGSAMEWGATHGHARTDLIDLRQPSDQIAAVADELRGLARVGVANYECVPAPLAHALGIEPAEGRLAPTDLLDAIRRIKSPVEIELMRAAARVADAGADAFAAAVATGGLTEIEVASAVEGAMRDAGLERLEATVLAAGPRGADVTMTPRNVPIGPGDLALLDNACRYDGYCADLARGAIADAPTPEQLRMLETTLRMYEEGRALLRPGGDALAIDERCAEIAREAGYDYPFGTGHSLGCDFHETPYIWATSRPGIDTLEQDMVVCIEPGLYVPGVGGVRFENVIHITADGPVELTRSPLRFW